MMSLKGLKVPKSEKVLKQTNKQKKNPVSMTYVKGTQTPNEKIKAFMRYIQNIFSKNI